MDASKASYAVLDECDTSTISTITNSNNPDKLWAVRELLAESEDRQLVLVLWQGYPLKEATWEPKENVIEELLTSWEEERSQNGHGRQSKLKIGAWKKAVVESLLIEVPLNLRNYKRARGKRLTSYRRYLKRSLAYLDECQKGEGEDEKMATKALQLLAAALSASNYKNMECLKTWPTEVERVWKSFDQEGVDFQPQIIKHFMANPKAWLRKQRAILKSDREVTSQRAREIGHFHVDKRYIVAMNSLNDSLSKYYSSS
ncbi:putative chromo domain-containing protein [Ilyonectria robusta]